MDLVISATHISPARKLLTRFKFERFTLPVLTHVLATFDSAGLALWIPDQISTHYTHVPRTGTLGKTFQT
jgi:hypothetical protein